MFSAIRASRVVCLRTALVFVHVGLLAGVPAPADDRSVIIAVREDQRIRFLDPGDLTDVGEFTTPHPVHRVIPAGDSLFLEMIIDRNCCTLFGLSLGDLRLRPLVEPTGGTTVSGDGRFVLTQRGNFGIEVVDAEDLEASRKIAVSGIWSLHEGGGSRVLGTKNDGSAAAIFDPRDGSVVRRFRLEGLQAQAVWMSDRFRILSADSGRGQLWWLTADSQELDGPVAVELPGSLTAQDYLPFRLLSMGDRLFVYEFFGFTLDRRRRLGQTHPGGLIEVEPSSGAVLRHLAPDLHAKQVIAVPGRGESVYLLDVEGFKPARIVEVDTRSGAVLQERELEPANWSVAVGRISEQRLAGRSAAVVP